MFMPIWLLPLVVVLNSGLSDAAIIKNINRQDVKTPWELEEALYATNMLQGFNGTWITDNELYYTAIDRSIHKYNAASNTDEVFVTSDFLKELYNTSSRFTLSPDLKQILVRYDDEQLFRHSSIAKFDLFDIETKTAIPIKKGEKLQFCTWSPFKDRLSYVFDNNVYIHFEIGLEVRITVEGVPGIIYNGVPDWVYEEEVLSSGSAMWWSPDGLRLAVGTFNDTNVKTFKYHMYGDGQNIDYQYPKEIDLKYPKSGTPNPVVALRIFDLSNPEPSSLRITAPTDKVTDDHILQDVVWANNETVLITWLNRRQNVSSMQLCSMEKECREVKRFEEPEGWVIKTSPICLKNTASCIFIYWIGDWQQVWKLDLTTGENKWSSRGDFTVKKIYGYDEENDNLYYQATLKGNPMIIHIFRNDDCLTCNLKDVDGVTCTTASASFSKNFSYYAVTCSGPNPSYTQIFETKGNKKVIDWELNTNARSYFKTKPKQEIRFMNVTLADGSMGVARLQLPTDFDENKKYPMVVNVYGGPDSVRVTSNFVISFDAFITTRREVIYATIDGRGTGDKGKKLLFSVNNNLGEHEVEDQIHVTKFLQNNLPYVDRERTGIWGWSYGGFMTAKTIANDTERVFQCGVSVAPVTSWLYYDTIYTERYMGLPTPEDNLEKYKESSVLERIENFRNHDFLLVHGSGDDNVHYQQSLILAKVLQHNDIMFEEMTYTDENHSIGHYLPHLYNTIDHFWINCLNLDAEDDGVSK